METYDNSQDDSKYNAGIDAEKRVMEIFKNIDLLPNMELGDNQKVKHSLVKQLCLATRGMFNDKKVRVDIWGKFKKINLKSGNVSHKEGKIKNGVLFTSKVDNELDELIIIVTDYLQDKKGFFSPQGDEGGL